MARFLLGLIVGVASSGIAWALTHSLHWTAIVGLVVLALAWFGEFILDDLL
ncbi:hypothetical protein [Streptomyces sp. NPDC096324]|uniref:hypothetical protein n=1 Tax=Streptomyces sp. NPDC096324 TaxID=3366085 RepID=UPI003815F0A4